MLTSVMLCTYNRLELTKRMLKSLFDNTNSWFRLIIVDNGSTDGTIEFLKDLKANSSSPFLQDIHLHFNDVNRGIAIGRNQCLKIADEYNDEWLSTIDNDVEFPYGWLKECIEILKVNPNYAVGVNMENVEYPLVNKNGKTFQHKSKGNLGTACTVFNVRLHKLLGFFDTSMGLYGHEDANFFLRARAIGYELGYIAKMGNHFGVGDLDKGEYRTFKDSSFEKQLKVFQKNVPGYFQGTKSCYLPFREIHLIPKNDKP